MHTLNWMRHRRGLTIVAVAVSVGVANRSFDYRRSVAHHTAIVTHKFRINIIVHLY